MEELRDEGERREKGEEREGREEGEGRRRGGVGLVVPKPRLKNWKRGLIALPCIFCR